ncbi:MAG: GAF domain-containing protein [Ferrovibrio sp.]
MDRTNAAIRATNGGAQGLEPIYEAVCRDITAQLGCTRASVWLFNLAGDAIHCQCLLDRRETEFPAGMVLTAANMPLYFDMICKDRLLVIPDYAQHPATRNLAAPYARTSGIRALIDIMVPDQRGLPVAIVSAEQDRPREWSEADILYMYQIANLLTLTFKYRGRVAA